MKKTFDGMYYKHQKGIRTVAIIAGISAGCHAFIQVITNSNSYDFNYPPSVYESYNSGETVRIGDSVFSKDGVKIRIVSQEKSLSICGDIIYSGITPLRYDIMGPFKYLPMQCRHRVSSLYHRLDGSLTVNGENIDFTGGTGYIEGDSGTSFPKSYMWIQCGDFIDCQDKACIMASAADIPFAGLHFCGCICVVYINGTEYRLATYLGAKVILCDENHIIIKQGKLRLEIEINTDDADTGHKLAAPEKGEMVREIYERIACGARFKFTRGGEVLFDKRSETTSFEYLN
ncbi:MAG: tocopherol cyclase family protein [Oscillospiraceae bacterium]|nr:tocopherol cyclase family protein [Oscillospiraceae bacterium]